MGKKLRGRWWEMYGKQEKRGREQDSQGNGKQEK